MFKIVSIAVILVSCNPMIQPEPEQCEGPSPASPIPLPDGSREDPSCQPDNAADVRAQLLR